MPGLHLQDEGPDVQRAKCDARAVNCLVTADGSTTCSFLVVFLSPSASLRLPRQSALVVGGASFLDGQRHFLARFVVENHGLVSEQATNRVSP